MLSLWPENEEDVVCLQTKKEYTVEILATDDRMLVVTRMQYGMLLWAHSTPYSPINQIGHCSAHKPMSIFSCIMYNMIVLEQTYHICLFHFVAVVDFDVTNNGSSYVISINTRHERVAALWTLTAWFKMLFDTCGNVKGTREEKDSL